jgi:hypothetical protein
MVLLDDRHVDQAVSLDEVPQHRPVLQHRAAEIDLGKVFLAGEQHARARSFAGLPDTGAKETASGIVAADIGHDHPTGTRRQAMPHHLADEGGMRVGPLLRRAVPTDVRFHHDRLAGLNEPCDPADAIQRRVQSGDGIGVSSRSQYRERGIGRDLEAINLGE